ncbi:hypothetical protein [Bradyrhizobium lablabi]|uniref:hypothetical protein n=1 Tax=Bradyrhizobium lablabi TaxID=722472 RepID=UPI001BA92C63|nr:hypothetical protein [Bradyrhizobium lablabi]MBR0696290.1 hypothetical protein [Bradyrhizobium lablabi]
MPPMFARFPANLRPAAIDSRIIPGDWDGVVRCEVLECDPPRLLRCSRKGGADTDPAYGSRVDSTVTWTLKAIEVARSFAWCMMASSCPATAGL